MMKKMLVFLMVLTLTGIASAGTISYSASASSIDAVSTVTVTVSANNFSGDGLVNIAQVDQLYTLLSGQVASFTTSNFQENPLFNNAAGTNPAISDADLLVTPPGPYPGTTAMLFTFDVTSPAGSPADVLNIALDTSTTPYVLDSNFSFATGTAGAGTSITFIPEPITVVLMGLGGLFLRRRR
jgi:hypothetical protein